MLIKTAIGILLVALLAGCKPEGTATKGNATEPKRVFNGLELILQSDKAIYQFKEPIVLQLVVTNKGSEPLKLTFRSAQKYDFLVKKDSEEIWRWSHGRMFAMMLTDFALEPGESATYKEMWKEARLKSGIHGGEFVPSGKYKVIGMLKTRPESLSLTLTLEVKAN